MKLSGQDPHKHLYARNRRSYELRCEQYRSDLSLMQELASMLMSSNDVYSRLQEAIRAIA